MIQYQDLYLCTDKFEHFFGRGYIYFYEHFINKRPIENVLAQSTNDEKMLLGGMWFLTGIFSYADLVANLNGMRFWNDFLKDHKDLLGRELEPVVKCENRKWVVNRDIHFADYIDAGLDEAVNCIQTATENGARGILKSLAELQAADPQNSYGCPVSSEKIESLKEKYGQFSPWIFNFESIKKYENNFPMVQDENLYR